MPELASPNSTLNSSVSTASARILLVEDDRTMEPLWRYILEAASPGCEIEWVTSGEAARKRLSQRFDLVIADIFLGGETTGLDLWEILVDDSQSAFILMSVLSAQRLAILAENSQRGWPSRLPPYIQKPVDPEQCIETVRALLAHRPPRPS